jgi:acetyl esterase/lipase
MLSQRISIVARVGAWLVLTLGTAWVGGIAERAFHQAEIPSAVVARQDVVYRTADGHRLLLDIYLPPGDISSAEGGLGQPAILAIHGGSWIGGSRRLFRPSLWNRHPTAIRLAESGFVVVAADYRLARPGTPSWPEALDDLREAVRWIRRHAPELGVDPRRIAALGQSAGGHLAALLGTFPAPDDDARVEAVVDFYGPSDLERLPLQRVQRLPREPVHVFLSDHTAAPSAKAREASPVYHVHRESAPVLLIHGTSDSWVPLEQSEEFAKALRTAGVLHQWIRVDGARHGFDAEVEEPGHLDLLPAILAFLQTVWNVPSR